MIGSFLGDGNIQYTSKKRCRLRIIHGINQQEYCKWKAAMFHVNCTIIENNGYSKKQAIRFNSKIFDLPNDPLVKSHCQVDLTFDSPNSRLVGFSCLINPNSH